MNILTKSRDMMRMIRESSNVFLMAHKDLDLDAINSCIAMDFYLKLMKKKSYIIIDDTKQELGVKKVLDGEKKKVSIIKSKKIGDYKDDKSLLIILDTSKAKLVQSPDIIPSFNRIINIDHHDKTNESLRVSLRLIDEDSSSTCEMLTMFFKENNIKITKHLATLLLGGIVLDTNNYKLKTTANTFYASYYLMSIGAKMADINELLKQDINDYIDRQKIISSVKVIKNVAIGQGRQRSEYKKEELAKTADILLTFSKIEASFVIGKIEHDEIRISARSLGNINVGEILANFGGGGDESEAAATIPNTNVKKVFEELSKIIKSL